MSDLPRPSAGLLFLHAQTAVHAGSGTALGAVDLPVQRERHTGYPTIPGSALKGVLRDVCRELARGHHGGDRQAADRDDMLTTAFGPAAGANREGEAFAGAVSLTDARILAFPVRSACGVFAWVTCPNVVRRLVADLKLTGVANPAGLACPEKVVSGRALFGRDGPLAVGGDNVNLVLEEFDFEHDGEEAVSAWVAANAVDPKTGDRLKGHLAVLSDDDFGHFVRHATEIAARVALDYTTKTVKGTALFYQEFVPAETIFYSAVLASSSRTKNAAKSAEEVLAYIGAAVTARPVIQVGGDETTGKGYCFVRLGHANGGAL